MHPVGFQGEQRADGIFEVFADSGGRAAIRVLLAKGQRLAKRHAHVVQARQQALLRPRVERSANRDRHGIGVTVQHDSANAAQKRPEPPVGERRPSGNHTMEYPRRSRLRAVSIAAARSRSDRLEEPDTRG